MTAFPVAELPLHPPENTNTLWALLGNMRGGGGRRDTQTDGEESKKLMWERRVRKWNWRAMRWDTCTCTEWLRVKLCNYVFLVFFPFVSFLEVAHDLALLTQQQSFLTLHICASTVWPNSLNFLKTQKNGIHLAVWQSVAMFPYLKPASQQKYSNLTKAIVSSEIKWSNEHFLQRHYTKVYDITFRRWSSNSVTPNWLFWKCTNYCNMALHYEQTFYYIILDECFSKCYK